MVVSKVDIHIFPEYRTKVSPSQLRLVARKALEVGGASGPTELGLVIADDATVHRLNLQYRGLDEPTDVLAFSFFHGDSSLGEWPAIDFPALPSTVAQLPPLGEVIISYPQAQRQAQESGIQVQQEIDHLVTHGILHLLAYDHHEAREESEMQAKERAVLAFFQEGKPKVRP